VKFLSGLADRLRDGLGKTRTALEDGFARIFQGQELQRDTVEDLESLLLQADLGLDTAEAFVEKVREQSRAGRLTDGDARRALGDHLRETLAGAGVPLNLDARPAVVLVVGVNGSGKTTTCGKLAWRLQQEGHTVVLGAGDTFRAAAIEQLERWGQRIGAPVVSQGPGADPSAVAFDAVKRRRRATPRSDRGPGWPASHEVGPMAELAGQTRDRPAYRALRTRCSCLDATTGRTASPGAGLQQALGLTGSS
jgi:fused signal recognition particle receptor